MHKIFDCKDVVFIDMGNTLLDFHQGLSDDDKDLIGLNNMSEYLKSIGLNVSVDTLKKEFLDLLYNKFHLREEQLIEIDVKEILDGFLVIEEHAFMSLMRSFYKPYKDDVIVHKGGEELLSGLKDMNKKVGIISNCYLPSFVYKEIFIEVGLDKYIDFYTFSYDHKIRKPRHELYEKAFELYDVPKKKMLMIGDGFKPDILGSSDVGIDAIWYNHKRREQKQKTMHLKLMIHQLDELL